MRRKVYPEYKPSGIEWIGEIPKHWKKVRFKYVLWLQRGHDLPVTEFQNGKYPVYGSNGLIGYHNQFTTKGPGITVGRSGSVGEVNYIAKDYWAHNTALYVKDFRRSSPRYAFYLLKTLDVKSLSQGTAVGTLNRNYIHNLPIAIPVVIEQHVIAKFLDRETARIDKLIEKKERQIELLQEKRAALISHAVTKGLDPSVKMKGSGIEWLGKIPEHWEVKRLKHVVQCLDGRRIPLNAEQRSQMPGKYPYWGANGVVDYLDKWIFHEELVLLGEDGAPFFEKFRDVAFFIKDKVWVNNHIHVLRPLGSIVPSYLVHVLNITDYIAFIDGTTRDKLTQGKMNDITVLFPPQSEQHAIAAFLDRETARIDMLIEKINKSIHLLREYRTALISSAVTGKIDVRGN